MIRDDSPRNGSVVPGTFGARPSVRPVRALEVQRFQSAREIPSHSYEEETVSPRRSAERPRRPRRKSSMNWTIIGCVTLITILAGLVILVLWSRNNTAQEQLKGYSQKVQDYDALESKLASKEEQLREAENKLRQAASSATSATNSAAAVMPVVSGDVASLKQQIANLTQQNNQQKIRADNLEIEAKKAKHVADVGKSNPNTNRVCVGSIAAMGGLMLGGGAGLMYARDEAEEARAKADPVEADGSEADVDTAGTASGEGLVEESWDSLTDGDDPNHWAIIFVVLGSVILLGLMGYCIMRCCQDKHKNDTGSQ